MPIIITDLEIRDIRFPTSRELDGSDAMNAAPDYSAAYVIVHTNVAGLDGHGLAFTIGRGNEICVAAAQALKPAVVGRSLEQISADMGQFWRDLIGDSHLRWIGPEKGAIHMGMSAVLNAIWDLWAKAEGKPLWKLVSDMTPQQLLRCLDFRYVTDALTPEEALEILQRAAGSKARREAEILRDGYPAYLTSTGWLGYPDEKLRALTRQAVEDGWNHIKIKVGGNVEDDVRRLRIVREEIGPDRKLMIDANQVWDVKQAIEWMQRLREFNPWWIEEPTSPDDVLGHAAIRRAIHPLQVATGEHCHNRIMFKQFMQAEAIDFCQLDSCRLASVNEVIVVLLLAAKFDVPVCPHAGGVGLCEYVQHLSIIDYLCVSGSLENRVTEYVSHLHEHFVDPCVVQGCHYVAPRTPGYSARIRDASLEQYEFPRGRAWAELQEK